MTVRKEKKQKKTEKIKIRRGDHQKRKFKN